MVTVPDPYGEYPSVPVSRVWYDPDPFLLGDDGNSGVFCAVSDRKSFLFHDFCTDRILLLDGDNEIQAAIREGTIAYEMVRPLSLYGNWYSQVLANRVAPTMLSCMPVLIFAILMPSPFRISFPGFAQVGLFALSLVLGLGVVAALAILMHISLFYTTSPRGIKIMVTAVTTFFSGGLIPLTIFPPVFRQIAERLPFAACQSTPLLLFSGTLQGAAAAEAIGLQVFWLIAMIGLGVLWMKNTLKRVVVLGG